MREPVSIRWRCWIILAVLPWLVSCSSLRLSYNQGPTLAYWWLDGYADFSDEQAPGVKAALIDWFAWHRATQLPEYAQALAAMQGLAADKVTPAQVCSTIEAWQRRINKGFEHAVPALAEQLQALSPEQISHLERKQAGKHKEMQADYLQPVPAERQKANFVRTLDRAETVYGTLEEPQRRQLAAALAASPFNPELWLNERRQRNAEIVRSLRQWQAERADATTVQAGLRRLAAEVSRSPRAEYQAYATSLAEANCMLVTRLHNSTTLAQRQRAIERLKGWEADLRALAERGL